MVVLLYVIVKSRGKNLNKWYLVQSCKHDWKKNEPVYEEKEYLNSKKEQRMLWKCKYSGILKKKKKKMCARKV